VCKMFDAQCGIYPASSLMIYTAAPQLSFEEVMRLVQAGEEVPGVTKLDIQPSNQDPTPSQMERRPKPWETSVSHSVPAETLKGGGACTTPLKCLPFSQFLIIITAVICQEKETSTHDFCNASVAPEN
uniref:Peroxisomal membrane protein PEX14-like KPWE domain-containing protein n=1 Tax=Myripristis murdjan TaxID=586833 RepID=A0A667XAX0_9TELE